MACRKAADRGITVLSEHMEQQQIWEGHQRQIWTPPDVLDGCCLQWLAHGYEMQSHRDFVTGTRGCSGGCGKAHPTIVLDFDPDQGRAVAQPSHALDPIVQYLKGELSFSTKASLTGLLSIAVDKLKAKFGSHLVRVSPKALRASQRYHEQMLEQEELARQAERRKVQGKAANNHLLHSVLEICYQYSLQDHLDIADISWMRLACKTMGTIAARMARNRMKRIRLSYSVLVDGVLQLHNYTTALSERCILTNDYDFEVYQFAACRQPLSLLHHTTNTFLPNHNGDSPPFLEWSSPAIGGSNQGQEGYIAPHCYRGHLIRIYLEGTPAASPEENVLFPRPLRDATSSKRLEVAQYALDNTTPGMHQSSNLSYTVTSSETATNEDGSVHYRGKFALGSIAFGFGDLLGVYVRKKLPVARARYQANPHKGPAERQYVKALAKAAREAPGSAAAFRGMMGWRCTYGGASTHSERLSCMWGAQSAAPGNPIQMK